MPKVAASFGAYVPVHKIHRAKNKKILALVKLNIEDSMKFLCELNPDKYSNLLAKLDSVLVDHQDSNPSVFYKLMEDKLIEIKSDLLMELAEINSIVDQADALVMYFGLKNKKGV